MVAKIVNTLIVNDKKQEIISYKDETSTIITTQENLLEIRTNYISSLYSIYTKITESGTLEHSVHKGEVKSTARTTINNATTTILEDGSVETSAGESYNDGHILKAIVKTDSDAKTKTEFIHYVNQRREPYLQTLSENSYYEKGSLSEIKIYDNTLFIKTTTVLNNNLTIQ